MRECVAFSEVHSHGELRKQGGAALHGCTLAVAAAGRLH